MAGSVEKAPSWSSQWMFLLASMGCTIGLGNIWRFPFVAGENGGGAFLLVYAGALFLIAIPVMLAELYVGHRGRGDPVRAIGRVAAENGRRRSWSWAGHLMAALGLIYLFYYPVIGSWALHYMGLSLSGSLAATPAAALPSLYEGLMADGWHMLLLHTLFLPAAAIVTALGLEAGLESLARYVMPLLLGLIAGLLVYVGVTIGLSGGLAFLFTPDLSAITPDVLLAAVGQALFSTAVGQGVLLVYAGYLGERVQLPAYSAVISVADATVAILAGIFIFSIVAHFGLSAAAGEGLVYMALPLAFADMAGGMVVGAAFFLLLALAAFTSVVPTIELLARWLQQQFGMAHRRAALLVGAAGWVGGLTVLWSKANPAAGPDLLRLYDYAVSNLMIPTAALALALFVGWRVPAARLGSEAGLRNRPFFLAWLWCLRVVAPLAILAIFLVNL